MGNVPTTLSGSPVVSAYIGNDTTQLTAGITLSADFDSVTGLNNVRVVATSGNGYTTGTEVQLIVTTGTLGGQSVAGMHVGSFSIEKRFPFLALPVGGNARLAIVDSGTAAAIAASTITLRSGHGVSNSSAVMIRLVSGTNAVGKARLASYSGAGDVFNVDPSWDSNGETTPSGTITYQVYAMVPNPTSTVPSVSLTAAGITALWAQLNASNTTAGSVGKKLADIAVDGSGDIVLAATTHTGAVIPDVTTVATVSGAVGSVTGNVGGNVTGSVGSLATQAKADVNAEVVDALGTDTYAEPGQGAPAATTTLAAKIGYLYKAFRNKITQTATEQKLFADDASTVDQKATISDDGTTYTKGEVGTGP